jgi:predicted nucleotidyltransferase
MAGSRSELERVFEQVRDDLRRLNRPFAVIGGLAVSARTEPRFTRDIDLAVAVATDHEAERLARDLQAAGYRIAAMIEQEAVGRLATLRLLSPAIGHEPRVVVDVLMGSSGIEPEVVATATPLEIFPGLNVPVAGIAELIALKVLARDDERRPQDLVDLRALMKEATPGDRQKTRRLLELIEERGFHRNRKLVEDFSRLFVGEGRMDN